MEQALKPCPFCGSPNVAQGASRDYISVWCFCGARGPEVPFPENCIDPVTPIKECHTLWNRRASAEAQGNVAVEPVAWQYRTKSVQKAGVGLVWSDWKNGRGGKGYGYESEERALYSASSIASLSERLAEVERERDDALSRVDELESEAETVSAEFEGDCWKAMRSLLTACKFSWRDVEPDGMSAEDAREYIATTLDEIEKGKTRNRERAEAAEHQNAELRAKLAEAQDAPRWMPIETAPKDGASVLLFTHWAGDEIAPDPFDEVQIGYWDEGNLSGDIFHREQGWSTTRIGEPAHWQPLPAAPMSQEG